MLLLPGQEFSGPLHILPDQLHLIIQLLLADLEFFLNFWQKGIPFHLSFNLQDLLGEPRSLTITAPFLQFLQSIAVALLYCLGLPLLRGIRSGLQVRFQR